MINFVIYEKNNALKTKYEMIIFNFLGGKEEKFHIFDFNSFNKKTKSRNIYILSSKNINKLLSLAQDIRKNDGFLNQIIIITDKNNLNLDLLNNKYLILNYIDINDINLNEILKESLCDGYNILTKDLTFNFSLNGEIHKIPFSDILYIEKSNNQNYCNIYTINNTYTIKTSINKLNKSIKNVCFFKTHRSCIVNMDNIKHYKPSTNVITFIDNSNIDLIARDKRGVFKDKIVKSKIEK